MKKSTTKTNASVFNINTLRTIEITNLKEIKGGAEIIIHDLDSM